jgi:hypothetical protein
MKRVWSSSEPMKKQSGYFKLSHNPTGLIFKEIQKKMKKGLDGK